MKKNNVYLAVMILWCALAYSQELDKRNELEKEEEETPLFSWQKFDLSGYGALNYYNYGRYDSDQYIKDKVDIERLNLYVNYHFTDWITLKTEIEFEHGGTGTTMEFDTQEEAGEFEQEVESGGEVNLEQLYLDFAIHPAFNVKVGRFKLHLNLAQNLDKPIQYFTTGKPEMENEILPIGWYENGIQFYGDFFKKRFRYEFSITNGLNSEEFSSRNWIKRGHQKKFEMLTAESFAFTARVDYKLSKSKNAYFGVGAYINDASANRSKHDMEGISSYVKVFEAHLAYNEKNFRFNSVFLFGDLENSDIVSLNNRKLSNKLNAKRTPVGKQAIGFSVEAGYNILPFLIQKSKQQLFPFFRYDFYDTMHAVEGSVVKKEKWNRNVYTGGLNWFLTPNIVFKAQYQSRALGGEFIDKQTLEKGKAKENTFSLGMGFAFN